MDKIEELKNIIKNSSNIVFFGGAGVSTESGIPDFRSAKGLYNQKYKYPPEEIISHTFFEFKPEIFYEFYKEKMVYTHALPNACHYKLAELEREGKLKAIITQNIDGLHQLAGSRNVLELHGTIHSNHCVKCNKYYTLEEVMNQKGVSYCTCGGIIKPDVVLYEEGLDTNLLKKAVDYISNAEVLIVGGTSLVVYPAAGLVRYFHGNKLVVINMSKTDYDNYCDLVINEPIGDVFSRL